MTNPYRDKLEAEYAELQGRIYWQDIRRKVVQAALILLVGLGYTGGAEVFLVFLLFLILPLGVIALSQTVSLGRRKRRSKELEEILARS